MSIKRPNFHNAHIKVQLLNLSSELPILDIQNMWYWQIELTILFVSLNYKHDTCKDLECPKIPQTIYFCISPSNSFYLQHSCLPHFFANLLEIWSTDLEVRLFILYFVFRRMSCMWFGILLTKKMHAYHQWQSSPEKWHQLSVWRVQLQSRREGK